MNLYKNSYIDGIKIVKIFGIVIYKKYCIDNSIKRRYLGGIFKSVTIDNTTKYYFLNIRYRKTFNIEKAINQIKIQNNNLTNKILYTTEMAYAVWNLHKNVFPQFKNKHKNQAAVLIATGPTMLHYKKNSKLLHFAVNNAYKKITPDYWFAIDGQNIAQNYSELQKTDFVKFYGQCISQQHLYRSKDGNTLFHIPDYVIENSKNGYKFYFDHPSLKVNRDIESQSLPDLGSCVFSAMYFAIYAGIKKIYVVGCDSTANGYFDGKKQKPEWINGEVTFKLLRGWNIFKNYVETFHPDVEIISVNPVGLRGLFKDVYTKSYLEANPELKEELGENIEILDNI